MLFWANVIGVVHIVMEMWLAAGLFVSLLYPRTLRWYAATVALAIGSRLVYGGCPLTIWQEAIKRHPDVEPLMATSLIIEAPATWMGIQLGSHETEILMVGGLVIAATIHWHRRHRQHTPERPTLR